MGEIQVVYIHVGVAENALDSRQTVLEPEGWCSLSRGPGRNHSHTSTCMLQHYTLFSQLCFAVLSIAHPCAVSRHHLLHLQLTACCPHRVLLCSR